MKLVSHKELHNEWMQDDEYRAAWQEEERKEKLRELLAEWRKHDNLTKAQVAERMGVTPPVISRLENNITKASIDTLTRYAHACGIKNLSLPCTDDILPGFSFRRVGVVSTGKRGTGGLKPNGEEPYVNNVTI